MDLSKLSLQMDMEELKEALFSKKTDANSDNQSDENTPKIEEQKGESSVARQGRQVVAIFCIVIIVILAYIFGYYIPRQEAIAKKSVLLEEIHKQQSELPTLSDQIKNRTSQLSDAQKKYTTILSYFDKNKELEDLYKSVSNLAVNNNLTVVNIHSSPPAPVAIKQKLAADGTPIPVPVKKHQDNNVSMALSGKYTNYIKFKEALFNVKKLLTIHNESVSVVTNNKSSAIKVAISLNLSTYTIDKKPYLDVLDNEI